MARCNKSFYAILGIISKGEVSGYDIKQILLKIGRFYWSESNAQIYPLLKRMEESGEIYRDGDKVGLENGRNKC